MKIHLKIVGNELFNTLSREIDSLHAAFPKLSQLNEPVEYEIVHLADNIKPDHLLCYPEVPSVLLIDAEDPAFIEKLQTMEKKDLAFLRDPPFTPVVLAPVILIFRSYASLADSADFPDFVSDWICMPFAIPDLVRRVVSSLRRKNILKTKLRFGSLSLLPETRLLSYQGRTAHLTPSEYSLAELFLNQMGSVIPIQDLITLFKSTGKSTEGSNIRVTVFQLRLKLEMLTRSQFTLSSVYKQGYCLKQKARPVSELSARKEPPPALLPRRPLEESHD